MDDKRTVWIGSSREDLRHFPREARRKAGLELRAVQRGQEPTDFKPLPSVGAGVYEIRIHAQGAYRVFYVTKFERQSMYSTHSKRKLKKQPNATSKSVGSVTKRHRKLSNRGDDIGKINITQGSDNVFEDVGFEPKEAANLKIRADLMIDLREYIRSRGWTQAQAAVFFGETQPRISNLLKGEISRFSIDKLISMLARAGIRVRLQTEQRAA